MGYIKRFFNRPAAIILAVTLLFLISNAGWHIKCACAGESASSERKTYIATSANGDRIPNPTSGLTYTVKDGSTTVKVPEGMVYIPAGSFVMGTEKTAHAVKLSGYCIGKYHVTNAEYKIFCDEIGKDYRPHYWGATDTEINAFLAKRGNHPVLGITYTNALAYCAWVSSKTGWKVTLPSEAQWERAARGATTDGSQYLYPWGNDISYDDYSTHTTYIMTAAVMYGQPKKEVI
jgi:formylglycine-generating enzyme required for sulfatase activity